MAANVRSGHVGQIQGAAQLLTVVASAVGQWMFPVAKEWFGSFVPLLQGLAAVAVLLAVWVWLVPPPRRIADRYTFAVDSAPLTNSAVDGARPTSMGAP